MIYFLLFLFTYGYLLVLFIFSVRCALFGAGPFNDDFVSGQRWGKIFMFCFSFTSLKSLIFLSFPFFLLTASFPRETPFVYLSDSPQKQPFSKLTLLVLHTLTPLSYGQDSEQLSLICVQYFDIYCCTFSFCG